MFTSAAILQHGTAVNQKAKARHDTPTDLRVVSVPRVAGISLGCRLMDEVEGVHSQCCFAFTLDRVPYAYGVVDRVVRGGVSMETEHVSCGVVYWRHSRCDDCRFSWHFGRFIC